MKRVEEGDYVGVLYEGLLGNNEVFESTTDTGPLEFQVGEGSVFAGFEKAILGMAENEQKTVDLQPEETYGPKRKELIHTLKRGALGEKISPSPGMLLGMTMEKDGKTLKIPAMVVEVEGDDVTIDFNHPLAGQVLTYKITVKSIKKNS